MKKLLIDINELYDYIHSGGSANVRSKSGEIVPIRDAVKKTSVPCVEVSFPGYTRRVAATHRFSYKGREVYAKDALAVDTRTGIVQVSSTPIEDQDVYDIMIDEPHWYTDQYGVIHHNTGKSLGLCSLAADYIKEGKNVIYFSMEMSEIACAKRIDANLLDVTLDDIDDGNIGYSEYKKKMEKYQASESMGLLEIKRFPTGGANANTFRSYLNEIKLKKGFVPDIIIVDYLGICASTRIKVYSENSYTLVKYIAEEMRALAVDFDVPLWSAAQTTRGGWDNSDISMSDIAECLDINTIVNTPKGLIKIKDVKVGDSVLSHDGYRPVTRVSHIKKQNRYKITTKSGKEIVVSGNHKFPTTRGRISINSGLDIGDSFSVR